MRWGLRTTNEYFNSLNPLENCQGKLKMGPGQTSFLDNRHSCEGRWWHQTAYNRKQYPHELVFEFLVELLN